MSLKFKQNEDGSWMGYRVKEQETPAPELTDYASLDDNELAQLAANKSIDIDGKTRRQVINALKKADEQ